MAERLPDGDMQALQQFVSQSTWDHAPVLRAIATTLSAAITPQVWVIDDVSFPKDGKIRPYEPRSNVWVGWSSAQCQN